MSALLESIFIIIYLTVLLSVFSSGQSQRFEGDVCTYEEKSGHCQLLKNCGAAIDALQKGKYPQICGFLILEPIVCCVDEENDLTTTQKASTIIENQDENRSSDQHSSDTENQDNHVSENTKNSENVVGSKAKAMCQEYAQYVYEWITSPVQIFNAGKIKVNKCGHKVTELIIGGQVSGVREFPHMALLGMGPEDSKKWTCGGTLVSDEFVLTAAHCIFSIEDGEVKWIRLGENDLTNNLETDIQDFSVAEIIKYPDYKSPSRYNDIALLRLNRKAFLNKYVIPACLHSDFNIGHQKAIATGWGRQEYLGDTSKQLFKVTLELFSQEECNETYSAFISSRRLKFGIVPESQICAGHHTQIKDTCQGDSGGPLQVYLDDPYCMYDIIGITSFGITCGVANSPGVYTRVSEYLSWIEQTVWG